MKFCSCIVLSLDLARSGNITLFTLPASIQMLGSLFSRYTVVNGHMYDESDNSNIPFSIICTFCYLTSPLAQYGTGLEWPIIGVVSVMLNLYTFSLYFLGLLVKKSVQSVSATALSSVYP